MVTLMILKSNCPEELFQICYSFITEQGQASVNDGSDTCVYRSKDGLMCGVGCLLRDEVSLHVGDLEAGVDDMISELEDVFDIGTARDHMDLLDALQDMHDTAHRLATLKVGRKFLPDFQYRMTKYGKEQGYDLPS